jgi:uncharacterized protein
VDDDHIRDFLVRNPDYFQRHPDLLSLLQIPHASGSAVSLVERQVSVLRERNVDLRHRLRDLGSTARHNDQLFAETRSLVLALLEARDAAGLEQALMKVLRDDFDVEYGSLTLFEEHFDSDGDLRCVPESQLIGHLGSILGRGNAGCGALRADAFAGLFPGARTIGSAAVAFIELDGARLGAIAVGSSDAAHYSEDTGTLFLEFAAEVLARLLRRTGQD